MERSPLRADTQSSPKEMSKNHSRPCPMDHGLKCNLCQNAYLSTSSHSTPGHWLISSWPPERQRTETKKRRHMAQAVAIPGTQTVRHGGYAGVSHLLWKAHQASEGCVGPPHTYLPRTGKNMVVSLETLTC